MDSNLLLNGESETSTVPEINPIRNDKIMKNISPYMSKDLIAAAGFNVETPIVNAIIGNLTGTLPTKKSETGILKCEICDCELSSDIVLSFHVNGSRHKKRVRPVLQCVKALEIIAQLKNKKNRNILLGDCNSPNAFRCETCSLTVNSAQQLEIHLSGTKHKKKAANVDFCASVLPAQSKYSESDKNSDDLGSPSAKKKKREEPKLISCKICNVFSNSQIQYDQHLLSKKHLNKTKVTHHN